MSNLGFNYAMGGLRTLDGMAQLESARRFAKWKQDRESSLAQQQAIGTLIGGVAGGVKGYYNKNKTQHETEQAAKKRAYEEANTDERIRAIVEKREYKKPEPFTPEEFDFVRSVKRDFEDLGWF